MTLAVAEPTSAQPTVPQTVPIVVLGTDALLAALPATPVQLAHACLRAGFANVIPASWGDELVAAAVLRRLSQFGSGPAIQCSCPIVAHRLLSVGGDLRPAMVPTVPPPVAIARYVRTLSQPTRTRITYVGGCPGANDESIDVRMLPEALLAMLAERQIVLDEQPRVFESIIPPDRRRFRSLPGGVPSAEILWNELGARTLLEIDGEDVVVDLAQQLLSGKNVLIDVSARLGCACSGAVGATAAKDARSAVMGLEPPRSTTPVVEERAPIELDLPVPAAPRSPIDVGAVSSTVPLRALPTMSDSALGHRASPAGGTAGVPERSVRNSGPANARPVLGNVPVARDPEGKSLPRAYVARRRSSPKGLPALPVQEERTNPAPQKVGRSWATGQRAADPPQTAASPGASALSTPAVPAVPAVPALNSKPLLLSGALTPRQLVYITIAVVMLALSMSAVVGVIVGRLVRQPAPTTAAAPER